MKHISLNGNRNFKPHVPNSPKQTAPYNGIGEGGMNPASGSYTPKSLGKTNHARFKGMIKGKKGTC